MGDELLNCGLRVRMGIDVGWCRRKVHETTRTFRYSGTAVTVAKELVDALPIGGVIAVTHRVQSEIAPKISQIPGLVSVCDHGIHVLSRLTRQKVGVFSMMHQELALRTAALQSLRTHAVVAPGYMDAPGVRKIMATQLTLLQNSSIEPSSPVNKANKKHKLARWAAQLRLLQNSSIEPGSPVSKAGKKHELGRCGTSGHTAQTRAWLWHRRPSDSEVGGCVPAFGRGIPTEKVVITFASLLPVVKARLDTASLPSEAPACAPDARGCAGCLPGCPQDADYSSENLRGDERNSSIDSNFSSSNVLERMQQKVAERDEAVLKAAVRLARATLHRFEGYECQEDKGVFMLAFASAFASVQWGSAIGQIVDTHFRGRCHLAAGSHLDVPTEVRPHDTSGRADYFGSVVNAAARVHSRAVAAVGEGSCIYITPTLHDSVVQQLQGLDDDLGQGILFTSAGTHTLKGFKEPVELFQVSKAGHEIFNLDSLSVASSSADEA